MIKCSNISKTFDDIKAVDDVTCQIKEGSVFGLIGTNGAGKSTLLRIIAGVYKQDEGQITVDEGSVYDNPEVKKNVFFISDEPYYFANSTPQIMRDYYAQIYDNFSISEFDTYLEQFGLQKTRKINTFSKGMKKQLSMLLGLCSKTKYLLCDETFDGLDPVMRQAIKSLMAKEIDERELTVVIASHNLRELEDICDYVGLLHKGGVLLSKDLEDMKCSIQKVQCVFKNDEDMDRATKDLNVIKVDRRGSLNTITIRGSRESVEKAFEGIDTVFFEILPLSLEEIFISETEVVGYDIKTIILG